MVIRVNTDDQQKGPWVTTLLFRDTRMSLLWLVARVYVGWHWLDEGREKVTSPAWMDEGLVLRASWERAIAVPGQDNWVVPDAWSRAVVRFMLDNGWYGWCGKLIAVGEVVVGLALILGLFTGLAAFFGVLQTSQVLVVDGAVSTTPLVLGLALLLMVAWKTAGFIGLDAFVLPKPGASWQPGLLWKRISARARPGSA